MDKLHPPSPLQFSGNVAENWKKFKKRFEIYLNATRGADKDNQTKTLLLLHIMGEEAQEVYDTFKFDTEDGQSTAMVFDKVINMFDKYCTPKKNLTLERFHFMKAVQNNGESVDQFVIRLKTLSKSCEFGELEESLVKDRLVVGIIGDSVRERLLGEDNLSLERAIQICKSAELVRTQASELRGESASEINAIRQSRQYRPTHKGSKVNYSQSKGAIEETGRKDENSTQCTRCGSVHKAGNCPANGKICNKCKGRNHFAKCCLSKRKPAKISTVEEYPVIHEDLYVESVTVDSVKGQSTSWECPAPEGIKSVDSVKTENKDWIYPLLINEVIIPVKPDTGAQANIMSETDYKKLKNRPKIHTTKERLKGYYQSEIPVKGKCMLAVKHKMIKHNIAFFIVPGSTQPLLGWAACEKLELVKLICQVDNSNVSSEYETLLTEFSDVFKGLGNLPGEHKIVIDEYVTPVAHACRKVPFKLHDKLKEELDTWKN